MFGGIVIHGDAVGHTFGYPTANLDCPKKNVKHNHGVYAVWVYYNKKKYPGALVIQEKPWKVEVHLLEFEGDLYGKYLEVELVQKAGELERIDTDKEMVDKIRGDIDMIREILR